jgi:uncharacterized protein (UPF0276 family)
MGSAVAASTQLDPRAVRRAGVGLRLPHLLEVAAAAPPVGWLEIHPENFLANPHAREVLLEIAHRCALSVHTVGISVGSVDGVDREHLSRVAALVDELDPIFVSGHLAWSTHGGRFLNDLLPIPYDGEALRTVSAHVDEVQDVLGRPYLVENPASYVGFDGSTMTEVEFLSELVARTGCRLLCDVSNVYLSAMNMGYDPYDYIGALPVAAVGQLHLGGYTREEQDEALAGELLIDAHASPIAEPVWALYAYTLRRFGARPTLIEWDAELPAFSRLAQEAATADEIAAAVAAEGSSRAAAR